MVQRILVDDYQPVAVWRPGQEGTCKVILIESNFSESPFGAAYGRYQHYHCSPFRELTEESDPPPVRRPGGVEVLVRTHRQTKRSSASIDEFDVDIKVILLLSIPREGHLV